MWKLGKDIHAQPELAFGEQYAAVRITQLLVVEGFSVRRGIGGLPTAFIATIGTGPLHLAFCAEYDAADDSGPSLCHACGHNLIAGAAVAAATALRDLAESSGLTISVVGRSTRVADRPSPRIDVHV